MNRAVEIALDVLDRVQGSEVEQTLTYCINALLYREDWSEDASGLSKDTMLDVLKTHLRQSGALTGAERAELSAA